MHMPLQQSPTLRILSGKEHRIPGPYSVLSESLQIPAGSANTLQWPSLQLLGTTRGQPIDL